jgi:flavin reductase (DIM6/NTAB) family NADH-FMN oxidoreductase RutF
MSGTGLCATGFDPVSDPRAFRRALGRFATGVTVVTGCGDRGSVGMTANSFAGLSLTPPLVMWSPAKASRRHDLFVASAHFAIHVLSADQQHLCDAFVRADQTFDTLEHRISERGVPILAGCVAVFECGQVATHNAGDHTIIIGRVERATDYSAGGLLFVNGQFGTTPVPAPAIAG